MKRLFGLMLFLCLTTVLWAGPKEMSVQMEVGRLRAQPKRFGRITKAVPYGTRVTIVETQGDWFKVTGQGATGWLHASALTTKKLKPLSGQEAAMSKVSGAELATGSKGFTKQIEENYRKQNPSISYEWVDKLITQMKIPFKTCESFLTQGKLTIKVDEEGGAQ